MKNINQPSAAYSLLRGIAFPKEINPVYSYYNTETQKFEKCSPIIEAAEEEAKNTQTPIVVALNDYSEVVNDLFGDHSCINRKKLPGRIFTDNIFYNNEVKNHSADKITQMEIFQQEIAYHGGIQYGKVDKAPEIKERKEPKTKLGRFFEKKREIRAEKNELKRLKQLYKTGKNFVEADIYSIEKAYTLLPEQRNRKPDGKALDAIEIQSSRSVGKSVNNLMAEIDLDGSKYTISQDEYICYLLATDSLPVEDGVRNYPDGIITPEEAEKARELSNEEFRALAKHYYDEYC